MTDTEKILDAAKFMYNSQGYADVMSVAKIANIPFPIVDNVLEQNGWEKSGIEGQYVAK